MSMFDHFRVEERPFIEKVLKLKQHVEDSYSPKLTDFLNPREQFIFQSLMGEQQEIKCRFFGGKGKGERKRAFLFPDYYQPSEKDFQVGLYQVNYATKFCSISHSQVLGTLIGTGLKREKIGDIVVAEEGVQFYLCAELEQYVTMQIERIGMTKVTIEKLSLEKAIHIEEIWNEKNGTVSSLRLDAIVAETYQLSRQKAQSFIKAGLVVVNWTQQESSAFLCQQGDVFSLRGFGRAKLLHIDGKTKKDKWRITFGTKK